MAIERRWIERAAWRARVPVTRPARVALASLLLALGLLAGTGAALPRVAIACSCVGPQPLAAYASADNVIVAGTVVADGPEGIRLGVERWYAGEGATPSLLVEGDFGNGASCGIGIRPPVGTRWVGVLWRPAAEGVANPLEDRAVLTSICQPFADTSTPEGQSLLEEAEATFGGGVALPSASPEPSDEGRTPAGDGDTALLLAVGVALAAGVLVLALALVLGSRGRRTPG